MFDKKLFVEDCAAIRSRSPLVHNITNYVAMNVAANALLAIGASPLMSFCPDEMVDIVSISSVVAINTGTLDAQLIKAAKIAAATASAMGRKWVLDPVGAGASHLRTEVAADLASHYAPAVIRGNSSEIIELAYALGFVDSRPSGPSRGVDARDDIPGGAVVAAERLAAGTGAVVSMSGPVDYIVAPGCTEASDKKEVQVKCATIANGSPLMPRVTALGCTATALTAAFLAVDGDSFSAAANAMALMGVAGEIAAKSCRGTGSFTVNFIDTLSTFDPVSSSELIKCKI